MKVKFAYTPGVRKPERLQLILDIEDASGTDWIELSFTNLIEDIAQHFDTRDCTITHAELHVENPEDF